MTSSGPDPPVNDTSLQTVASGLVWTTSGPDPPVSDTSLQTVASGPGPPASPEATLSTSPPDDTHECVQGRRVEGSLDARQQQALEEGDGRTEEKSTLKPAPVTFESGSEGSAETEISPDVVREGVPETAGLRGAHPIQAVTRDGRDKMVLATDWLVETIEGGTSLRLVIQKDGSIEHRRFPSS